MFDTKVAIVIREDLATWQKLNVTAFLMSGIVGQDPEIIGDLYKDAQGNKFSALSRQPAIVLKADQDKLRTIHKRALDRQAQTAVYIEEMFSTGHDDANRAVFAEYGPDDAKLVGIAIREDKKMVDKITKGAKMHD